MACRDQPPHRLWTAPARKKTPAAPGGAGGSWTCGDCRGPGATTPREQPAEAEQRDGAGGRDDGGVVEGEDITRDTARAREEAESRGGRAAARAAVEVTVDGVVGVHIAVRDVGEGDLKDAVGAQVEAGAPAVPVVDREVLEIRIGNDLGQLGVAGIEPDIVGVPACRVVGISPGGQGDKGRGAGEGLGREAADILARRAVADERGGDIKRRGPHTRAAAVAHVTLGTLEGAAGLADAGDELGAPGGVDGHAQRVGRVGVHLEVGAPTRRQVVAVLPGEVDTVGIPEDVLEARTVLGARDRGRNQRGHHETNFARQALHLSSPLFPRTGTAPERSAPRRSDLSSAGTFSEQRIAVKGLSRRGKKIAQMTTGPEACVPVDDALSDLYCDRILFGIQRLPTKRPPSVGGSLGGWEARGPVPA